MSESPADIFERSGSFEEFVSVLKESNGRFPFSHKDMIALGNLYFERFPDSTSDRKMDEVHLGYALTRICIIEKAIAMLPEDRKDIYREILTGKILPNQEIEKLISLCGRSSVSTDCDLLSSAIDDIKIEIDNIPKGMVKERYVGGISNLYNILYIIKMVLRQAGGRV